MISRACTISDIRKIEPQCSQRVADPRMLLPSDIPDAVYDGLLRDTAFTLEEDRKVLACYGVVTRWEGVAEAWAVLSEEILAKPKALTRDALNKLDLVERRLDLRRIEATADETNHKAQRWLNALGFIEEGRSPGYGLNGETHIRYGRLRWRGPR